MGKTKLLAAVGNTKWGWQKQQLRQLFYAYVRSKVDYCGPGWQPWLSQTGIKTLQSAQNKALRVVTGQLRSCPIEALHYETGVERYETRIKRTTLKSVEMAKRLPPDHPRAAALASAIPPRNARRSWARLGAELSDNFIPPEAENRAPITHYHKPPWSSMNSVQIFPDLVVILTV